MSACKRLIEVAVPIKEVSAESVCDKSIRHVISPLCTFGGTASNEYVRVTFQPCEENDRRKVRKLLEEYCEQDTLGMIWIIDELQNLASI